MLSTMLVILVFISYGAVLTPYGRALNGCPENDMYCNTTSLELNPLFGGEQKEASTKRSSYPIKFVFSSETDAADISSQTRFRRFPKTCNDSLTPLRHTTITCWAWPNFLTCEFNCSHGYALMEDGHVLLNTTRNCREEESHWKPKATLPMCEPYIHCETVLVGSGTLSCKQEEGNPWYCDISCMAYGEHDEKPLQRYECLDHNYAKSLPHCASLDRSRVLIKPPKSLNAPPQEKLQNKRTEAHIKSKKMGM